MHLNLITYPEFFEGEAEILNALLADFDFTLHIRKPGAEDLSCEQLLENINAAYYSRVIIHQSEKICINLGLKGVHFPSRERPEELKGYSGTSCHSIEELEMLDGKYDYLYISPVYPSISKKAYSGNLDFGKLECFLQNRPKSKIYALGGIDVSRLQQLDTMGFDGLAILGAVWSEIPEKKKNCYGLFKKIITCLKTDPIV